MGVDNVQEEGDNDVQKDGINDDSGVVELSEIVAGSGNNVDGGDDRNDEKDSLEDDDKFNNMCDNFGKDIPDEETEKFIKDFFIKK